VDRFTAVDDFGNIINPMIVEGQVHGGLVQGIGQALLENCVYDKETGQLLTGSFMDYAMPRADDLPSSGRTPCARPARTTRWAPRAAARRGPSARRRR
jgi:carbon-monoxide dehydrogenase large subunit